MSRITDYSAKFRADSSFICILLLAMFFFLPWIQAVCCYELRDFVKKYPNVHNVPHVLKSNELSVNRRSKIVRFGCEFEIPFINIQRIDDYESVSRIVFSPDFVVLIFNPEKNIGGLDAIKTGTDKSELSDVVRLLSPEVMASNYSYTKAELESTPDQVSIMKSPLSVTRAFMFVILKSGTILSSRSGSIWLIENKVLKGFQIGDPAQDQIVDIKMFDRNDRQIEIWTILRTGAKFNVSQSDINVIIESLHPVEDSKVSAKK